jgi:SAM-dependent methyltransferase
MSAKVCAACTCVYATAYEGTVDDHYRARAWGGPPKAELVERSDGAIRPGDIELLRARRAEKLDALRTTLKASERLSATMLEVGCRDGRFVQAARQRFGGLRTEALEPWQPWRKAARELGVEARATSAETSVPGVFDIVVEFDLLDHFANPVEHLRALSSQLGPQGHLLVGVSAIDRTVGQLHPHRIRLDTPVGFTARALYFACISAGLQPSVWREGATVFALCRQGAPQTLAPPEQDAAELVRWFQENDGRLLLKRALFARGPTDGMLRAAELAVRNARIPAARQALCDDVVQACARARRHDAAVAWFGGASQNVA